MSFNIENLELALKVFDGLDPSKVKLDLFFAPCGTIACGFGHLAWSDEFREKGLKVKKSSVLPQSHPYHPSINGSSPSKAAQILFGGREHEVFNLLFVEKGCSDLDLQVPWSDMSDLDLLRYRFRALIRDIKMDDDDKPLYVGLRTF